MPENDVTSTRPKLGSMTEWVSSRRSLAGSVTQPGWFSRRMSNMETYAPPALTGLDREDLMSEKQFRRIKQLMPLRDFGWYQRNNPSCTLYSEPLVCI